MMNTIEIFIPRILGSITKNTVINIFKELKIGNITTIDMHKKINENNNAYSFAFISIDLYNNEYTKTFKHILDTKEYTRVTYDYHKNHYWEIKKHILPELRVKPRVPSPQSITGTVFFDNDADFKPTNNLIHPADSHSSWSTTDKEINLSPDGADLNLHQFKSEKIVKSVPCKLFETNFTQKDKDDLLKEYEELEMEMLQIFNENTIVNKNLQLYKLF